MVATLPALNTFATGHTVSTTEWTQVLNALKSLSNIKSGNFYSTMSASNSSASFVNVTGASVPGFVKQQASSDVLIIMSMSARVTTTANHAVVWGVNDGTTDWQVMTGWESVLNKHTPYIGCRTLTGLAVATYTFQARLKADGTNTIVVDVNDCGFIIAAELPK